MSKPTVLHPLNHWPVRSFQPGVRRWIRRQPILHRADDCHGDRLDPYAVEDDLDVMRREMAWHIVAFQGLGYRKLSPQEMFAHLDQGWD